MITEKIVLAADHAGYKLKEDIKKHLNKKGLEVKDLGTDSESAVDYPDYAHLLADEIEKGNFDYGISICGTGHGISMAANTHQGIRSSICWSEEISRLARFHNDANICSLPARFVSRELALKMVDIFVSTGFEGGRHIKRLKKIPCK